MRKSLGTAWALGNTGQSVLAGLALMVFLAVSDPVQAKESGASELPQGMHVEFSPHASTLVLSYTELLPELAEQDVTPRVRLYGDGRLLIHRPPYLKRSGTWETRLAHDEIDGLLRSVAPALYEFDDQSVRLDLAVRERDAASQATERGRGRRSMKEPRATLYARFDAPISYFELNVDAFGRPGSGTRVNLVTPLYVAWEGLSLDVRRFPDQIMLNNLHRAERAIRALEQRDDLVPSTELIP